VSDFRRYEPPHLTVKIVMGEEEAPALFRKVNVELTPQPQPMSFVVSSTGGDLTCTYDPAPLIGEIIHFYAWLLCPPVTVIPEFMEKLDCGKRRAKMYLADLYCDRMTMCIGTACNYARAQIEEYLGHTLKSVYDDAINHTFAERNDQAFRVEPVEGLIKSSMNEHRKRLRESLNLPTRGGKRWYYHDWTDEECIRLARFHEKVLPKMREAKSAYKKDPKGFRDKIDTQLISERHIERLTERYSYDSTPSNAALLWAAEALGVKPGLYKTESLRQYLKRGRKLINSGGAAVAEDFWGVKVWL